MGWSKTLHFSTFVVCFLYDPIWYVKSSPGISLRFANNSTGAPPTMAMAPPPSVALSACQQSRRSGAAALIQINFGKYQPICHSDGDMTVVIWMADKITYYLQWTWPKWVVSYRLWRFVLPCYVKKKVSGWSPIGCECLRTNLNIPCPLPTTLVFC